MPSIDDRESVSRTVLSCPHCRQENLPQWKFCAQCGAPLWEPCLQCGEPCAAGESYCGECGACLGDVAAEQIERMEADLHAAARLRAAMRFDEAIAALTQVRNREHPRLAEQVARAREMVGQMTVERRQRQTAAAEACVRARKQLESFDYDGAAVSIDGVPPTLETGEARQLRDEIAARRQELQRLVDELHHAIREKRLLELPSRIARVLALKPDHDDARKIASRVQKQLVAAAGKMLAEHRYDESLALLDRISAWADAADFQELRRRAAELSWLNWDLRHAPVVDATLAAVAERLRRTMPDDAVAAKFSEEIRRRLKHAAKKPQQPPPWARPPKETPLGMPVEWLSGVRRLAFAASFDRAAAFEKHPGRFAVACGLALAGLQQASLGINLLSSRRQGLLHRVKSLARQHGRSAWGIDLGAESLKAVKLHWNEATKQAVVEDAALLEHAKELPRAVNEAEEKSLMTETLKKFLESHAFKGDRVCVGIPGRMSISRRIDLPPTDLAKARKLVEYEAPSRFPFPLDQLAWDYEVLGDASSGGGHALLIAAKDATAQRHVEIFDSLGVRIDAMQPDFVALHNFLVRDELSTPADSSGAKATAAVAALDVGCDAASLVVSASDSLWFRSCGVAGHGFTRALVKAFNLTLAHAEERKRAPDAFERFGDYCEAMAPVLDDLVGEVRKSLEGYADSHPDRPVERLLCLGGGFLLHGLFRRLRFGR